MIRRVESVLLTFNFQDQNISKKKIIIVKMKIEIDIAGIYLSKIGIRCRVMIAMRYA